MLFVKRLFFANLLLISLLVNAHAMVDEAASVKCTRCFDYYPYKIDMEQFVVRLQACDDNACGLHAVHNALCFFRAHQDVSRVIELLKDDASFLMSRENCFCVNNDVDFSMPASHVKVYALLQALENYYKIDEEMCKDITVVSVEESAWLKDIPKDKELYCKLIEKIRQKRERFFKGYPQIFIINSCNHWLPFEVLWVADSLKVWTADSWFNFDATDVHTLNRILKLIFME